MRWEKGRSTQRSPPRRAASQSRKRLHAQQVKKAGGRLRRGRLLHPHPRTSMPITDVSSRYQQANLSQHLDTTAHQASAEQPAPETRRQSSPWCVVQHQKLGQTGLLVPPVTSQLRDVLPTARGETVKSFAPRSEDSGQPKASPGRGFYGVGSRQH